VIPGPDARETSRPRAVFNVGREVPMTSVRAAAALAALALFAAAAFADGPAPAAPTAPDAAKLAESLKAKEAADRLAAAQQAKDVQDEKVLAPLVALLDDADGGVRRAAIDALGHRVRVDAQKKASAALVAHLPKVSKRVETQLEQLATVDALGALAQPAALDVLMSGIDTDTAPELVRARLSAAANIPTAEAIESLIQFLAKQGRGQNGPQRDACRQALREATGENLGNDPDAWRAWWRDAKKTFDFDAAIRRRAAEKQKKEDAGRRRADKKGKQDGEGGGPDGKKDDDGKK
jgi:HEAT repeat protein